MNSAENEASSVVNPENTPYTQHSLIYETHALLIQFKSQVEINLHYKTRSH